MRHGLCRGEAITNSILTEELVLHSCKTTKFYSKNKDLSCIITTSTTNMAIKTQKPSMSHHPSNPYLILTLYFTIVDETDASGVPYIALEFKKNYPREITKGSLTCVLRSPNHLPPISCSTVTTPQPSRRNCRFGFKLRHAVLAAKQRCKIRSTVPVKINVLFQF